MTDSSAVPATTARSRADAEKAIAGLLTEHRHLSAEHNPNWTAARYVPAGCLCRKWEGGEWEHRTHVASVIAGYMADVWDESCEYHYREGCRSPEPRLCVDNPYRDEGNQP